MTTGGAIQFHNFVSSDNWIAGIAGKETHLSTYGLGDTMAMVRSIVIGRTMAHPDLSFCGLSGLETPWEKFAYTVHDMHFFNFDQPSPKISKEEFAMAHELPGRPCVAINPCYGSDAFDCGATTWYTDIRWTNAKRKLLTDWEHEYALRDIDGTLTESGGKEMFVVPKSGAYDPSHCKEEWPGDKDAVWIGHGIQARVRNRWFA